MALPTAKLTPFDRRVKQCRIRLLQTVEAYHSHHNKGQNGV